MAAAHAKHIRKRPTSKTVAALLIAAAAALLAAPAVALDVRLHVLVLTLPGV
jgi:hypothetical protein